MPNEDMRHVGAGTEGLNWTTDAASPIFSLERYVVRIEDDISIKMQDGVVLNARLFVPVLDRAGPGLLVANGYGRDTPIGAIIDVVNFDYASRGYRVLHVSLRGSGQSGGVNELYTRYGEDGYELVEWMAAQPWCDGAVGMIGASLLGISQWLTAKTAPPHLRAIAPHVAAGDAYRYLWYNGGMLPGEGRRARGDVGGVQREYATAMANRDLNAWWRERITLAADHKAIGDRGVAAFISGGFHDYLTPANIHAYEQYGGGKAKARLLVGPWAHGLPPTFAHELSVRFFDHHLRGVDTGVQTCPPVLIYVAGAERWRFEQDWPLPHEKRTNLYLSGAKSGSIASINDGSLKLQDLGAETAADVTYSPADGPFLPILLNVDGRTSADQTPSDARTVTWTSAQLAHATEITGYASLTVHISATATDADLVVNLTDVAPDGSSRQIVQGYANLSRVRDPANPTPLRPGEIIAYEIELLPISYVIAQGHRVRLALAGGAEAAPDQLSPQGPGKHRSEFRLTIHAGAAFPSALTLPVIGDDLSTRS